MTRRVFGHTGDLVPAIGQGTWKMEFDRTASIRALQAGLDAGLTHIDTAEMYGSGAVEKLVGEAIAGRRNEVFLVSKVLPSNASYDGTLAACDRSLKALATDRLDCYLLHWRGHYPLEETFRAFERLVQTGKILSFGVSNFDVDDLAESVAIVGANVIACNQVLYHLMERHIEQGVIPWCQAHRIAVVAYSPFGSGQFPSPTSRGGDVLSGIGARLRFSAHQVALMYLVRHSNVVTIPKSSSVAHVIENAKTLHAELTDDDIQAIDGAFPLRARRRLPMI